MHEIWLHYVVDHFEPVPGMLTVFEKESIIDVPWWASAELRATQESVYPLDLGEHFTQLQVNGHPSAPINIAAGQKAP